ncbi:MarR family winged helix-turn-helix transcriptional regulator [Kitasatospora sp. NPDC056783]|uniref:MarR family winged helix-turn-helix transcriptional regulator n=1 Tax=Kitasatospora sp. NPDC056783 TaxID=3345943 RepID=UPI0036A0DBD6
MKLSSDERLGQHLKRVEQELTALKHAVLKPYGLAVPQYNVLSVVAQEPKLSGAALARRCMVTPQTMSSVLGTLEGRGLVERKPHPIHSHILETRLTRTGRTLLTRADDAVAAVEARLSDAFTPDEFAALLEQLARCSAALEGAGAEMKATARAH